MSEWIGNVGLNFKAIESLRFINIKTIKDFVNHDEIEILLLDGIGAASMKKIKKALKDEKLHFKTLLRT